jgi:outer membrane protein TolC
MNRTTALAAGLLLAASFISGGCGAATKPYKFGKDEDFAHYNKVATEIEYPNVADCPGDTAITCPSPELIGPDSQPAYLDIKLEEAMQMGLARSRVMHDLGGTVLRSPPNTRTIADPAIIDTDARYGVEAALSEFDAVFHSRFDYQRNDRFVNNVFFGGGTRELRQDTDIFRSEITKTAATGTTFGFAHNTVYDHNNSPGNLFGSAWDTNFEATVRQPLLQGAGVEFNRIAGPKGTPGNLNGVLIARVNTDISLADFEIGLRDLVSNIENAYWDLYFAYRDLDAKITARDNALDSWRKTHALFIAGRRGGEAEKEAEAREQYFAFQEEVQNAWSGRLYEPTETNNGSGGGTFRATGGVRVAERRLRFLIGLPMSDGRLIRPADEPSMAKVVYNWDEVLPDAINARPELRRQRWTIKRDELALIASRNFLLPKFDSFGLYRIRGFGHDLKDGSDNTPENSAFHDLNSGNHDEWEAGLELTIPLGERQGHAAVRNAQLLISRDRAILDDQERQVVLDVSNAIAEVDRAYQVAQTAFNRRMAAKADVLSTKTAYEADKAPLDLYLEAQRRVATAESLFFAALVEYALAIKNLHYAKGSLLDYNEIYLAEGPWPGKAYHDAADRKATRWQPKPLNYIYHQPPPVSIGTEPNYPLPPPAGPIGPPPGPPIGPAPEELPKTPPVGPMGRPMVEPQLQPAGPPFNGPLQNGPMPLRPTQNGPIQDGPMQNGVPPTGDRRSAPMESTLRAATPEPVVRPAPAMTLSTQTESRPSIARALHDNEIHAPPPMRSVQSTPPSAAAFNPPSPPPPIRSTGSPPAIETGGSYRGRGQSADPVVQLAKAPEQQATEINRPAADRPPVDRPVAEFARIPTRPIALPSDTVQATPSIQRTFAATQELPAGDHERPSDPTTKTLNWLPPKNVASPVDRWQIPVFQPQSTTPQTANLRIAPHAPDTMGANVPRGDRHVPTVVPSEMNVPGESIYTSSAQRENPIRSPGPPQTNSSIAVVPSNPVRQSGDVGSRFAAPAAATSNDLRQNGFPSDIKPQMKPWPVSNDPPTARGVRTTNYIDGGNDRQRGAPSSTIVPISTGPSQPITRSLPPISTTQSLPSVMTTQPLPPIDGSTDRFPPAR